MEINRQEARFKRVFFSVFVNLVKHSHSLTTQFVTCFSSPFLVVAVKSDRLVSLLLLLDCS